MIVGTAEVVIVPVTKGFEKELKDSAAPGFASFQKDAETAGASAGLGMRTGVAKETEKLASDTEKAGAKAGDGLHKGVSGGLSKLAGAISQTGLPLGGLSTGLEKAGTAAEHAGSKSSGLTGSLDRLGKVALIGAAGGLAAVAAAGVHVGEEMQSAETKIASAAGTTVASANKIGNAFLSTAGKSEFSGVQMAQAFAAVAGQLASTEGHALSAKEALSVMSAASDLAAAKQIDLGTATSTLARVMQAFKINADGAGHASDVLFQASNATGQSVDALGNQLAKVKSKLGDTGGSVGDLSALLVDMTNQGITGRASLGALNAAMTSLQKAAEGVSQAQQAQSTVLGQMDPQVRALAEGYANGTISQKDFTKQTAGLSAEQKQLVTQFTTAQTAIATAQTKYKELGVSVFDAHGKFVGMGSIIDQLHPKFAQMTQQQQLAAAATLFGAGAARQMTAVIDAGPAAYDKATQAVNKHGAAQTAAARQAKTLHGEEATLKAEMSDLAAKVGAVLIPIITKMIAAFVSATTFVTSHKAALIALAAVVTGILGTAIAVFTVNKMAAFGRSFTEAAGHVKQFASDVEGVVHRVIAAFTKQTAASDLSAGKVAGNFGKQGTAAKTTATDTEGATKRVGTAEATMATETTAATSTIETDNVAAAGSFGKVTKGAVKEEVPLGTAETTLAGEVTTADTAIEGENAAAGASFGKLAASAVSALGRVAAIGIVAKAASDEILKLAHAHKDPQAGSGPNAPLPNSPVPGGFNIPKGIPFIGGTHIPIGIGAKGGMVTKPTVALIGEAGPEMLIPVGDLQALAAQGTPLPPLNMKPHAATGHPGSPGAAAGAPGTKRDLAGLGTDMGAAKDAVEQKSVLMAKSLTGVASKGTTPMRAGARRDLTGLSTDTATARDTVDAKSVLMVKSMTGIVALGTTPMHLGTKRDLASLVANTSTTRDVVDQKSTLMVRSMTGVVAVGTTPMRVGAQRDLTALAVNTAQSFGAAVNTTQTATKSMADAVSTQTQQAMSTGSKNFQGLGVNVATYMGATAGAVSKGLSNIDQQLNAALKAYGAGAVTPASVAAVSAGALSGMVSGAGVPGHFAGAKVTQPMYRVGEEAPAHPEYVIASNPAYRNRNLGLWAQAGKHLGVPGFAQGGATSGYTDPISGFTLSRTDMGVDASARVGTPIVAPGPSQMVGYQANWYHGQPEMVFQLTGGPGAGRYWYVAEQITPVAHMGQSVPQGGVVATFAPSGTGIEIGWAANAAGTTLAQATTGYHEGQVTPAGLSFRALIGGGSPGAAGAFGAAPWTDLKAPAWTGPGGALGQLGKGALAKALAAANAKGQQIAAASAGAGMASGQLVPGIMGIEQQAAQIAGLAFDPAIVSVLLSKESAGGMNLPAGGSLGATGPNQVIPMTFSAYAQPGHKNISNPLDNAIASMEYIRSRYGSLAGMAAATGLFGPGYHGYAQGGIPFAGAFGSGGSVTASSPTLAMFGDRGTETAHFVPGYATGGTPAKALAAIKAIVAGEQAGTDTPEVGPRGHVYVRHTPATGAERQADAIKIDLLKASTAKQTADAKAANTLLGKLVVGIHTGTLASLKTALISAHNLHLSALESKLDHDHSAAMSDLAKRLVDVHRHAMAAYAKQAAAAAQAAADATRTALLTGEATDLTREASGQAALVADATKVYLDQQAEQGKTGAELAAAQAQTALDQIAMRGESAIATAQAAVDHAAAGSPLAQAQAGYGLAQAQAAATIAQAQAQAALDRANALAQAAQAAPAPAPAPAPQEFNFSIYGNGTLTAAQLFSEVGWALRTGALPVAPAVPAHA